MKIEKKLITLLSLFFIVIYYQIASGDILLTDDLGRVNLHNETSYFSFVSNYLNTDTMTSRPVSGFIYSSTIYLLKYSIYFYYLNYLFFIASILTVYFVFSRLINDLTATISTFIYSFSLLSSSMVFSPIMMNASLAIIFYCISLHLIKNSKNFYVSIIFYILSVLSYEIMFPAILINACIFKSQLNKKIFYVLLGISLIYFYREIIEPSIFSNYFHRDKKTILTNTGRDIFVVKESLKMIFIEIPKSIVRSVIAMKYYSVLDIFSLIIMTIYFALYILKKNISNAINTKPIIIVSLFGTLVCFVVFFISEYFPNLYGFKNRNLGGIRLFSSILLTSLLLYVFKTKIKGFKIASIFIVFVLMICTISIKNAWIYSSKFNDYIFISLNKHLKKIDNKIPVLIVYNAEKKSKNDDLDFIFKDDHFILKEPIYMEIWETTYLKNKNGISSNFEINYFYSINKNKPDTYYLYDLKHDKIDLIKNNKNSLHNGRERSHIER